MTVWVVHPVRDDVSKALRFGNLAFITGGYVYGDLLEEGFSPNYDGPDYTLPRSFRDSLRHVAVHSFAPATDYLLIAGDHLQLLALTAYLSVIYPSFMVLRYDRKLDDYIPVRLHSGLVPTPLLVLSSVSDIGDVNEQDFVEALPILPIDRKTHE